VIARYDDAERGGNRVADWVELLVPVKRAVPVFMRELRGYRIAAPPDLGLALVAAGGIPARHAHRYERGPYDGPVTPPAGVRLTAVDRPVEDLLDAFAAAYPPEHPDRFEGDELADMLSMAIPEASALAVADGRVVGAILTADDEGPLILTVFRDPQHPGTGRALIQHALAAGLPKLSLVVTDGNPAERLYQRLGFVKTYTAFSVDLE